MTAFDASLWKKRADARYEKAVTAGVDKLGALERWRLDVKHISALASLVSWCAERSIDVKFTKRFAGVFYPEDKKIRVSGRSRPEIQVHVLLHECGHYLIGDKEKHERYGMGYPQEDPNVKRTFHHRCDILDEEFEAWHRGWRLAQRLELGLEKSRFDQTRTKFLKTHMMWALRVKGYGGADEDEDEDEDKVELASRQ